MRVESPASLGAALSMLAAEPALVPLAGGTDLMVGEPMQLRNLAGILDLSRIPEMRGIERIDGGLEIGAAVTFAELAGSTDVREHLPALAEAARVIGGWQIQNRATLGGNIANASPAGDSLPVLLALDAAVVAAGREGERSIPYLDFHTGYRSIALCPGELIARVRIPLPPSGSRQLFFKLGTREAQAISKVVVALYAELAGDEIVECRLAAGSVAPIPLRIVPVEELARGRRADEATAGEAGELAAISVKPIDDVRSTAVYRRFALGRMVRRLFLQLI